MKIGTPLAIGFYPQSQSHIDERYMNNGVPYMDKAEVLASIPPISRAPYLSVNIAGIEYWFLSDLVTLVTKIEALTLADKAVTLAKMADVESPSVFYRKTPGNGPPEIQSLETLKTDLNYEPKNENIQLHIYDKTTNPHNVTKDQVGLSNVDNTSDKDKPISDATQTELNKKQNTIGHVTENVANKVTSINAQSTNDQYPTAKLLFDTTEGIKAKFDNVYTLILPAASTVQGRCDSSIEGVNYPANWVISASGSNPNDLEITHNLDRRIASVTVFSVDGAIESQLSYNGAYSGIVANTTSVLTIQGLATIVTPIVIHLIFA